MKWKTFKEQYEIPKGLIPFLIGLIVFAVVGCSAIYVGLHGNPIKKYEAAKEVKQYLLQHNYQPEDIVSVKGEYSFKTDHDPYGAVVVFAKEPGVMYDYTVDDDHHIIQKRKYKIF